MKFYIDSKDSYNQIKLEEYAQVEIVEKDKKLLVTILNYFDGKNHKILRGITDSGNTSVILKPLTNEEQSGNVVYVGYNTHYSVEGEYLYLTWPLEINILENFKSKIIGGVYRPVVSDRIIKLRNITEEGTL